MGEDKNLKMKYKLTVLFGQEQVRKLVEQRIIQTEEKEQYLKTFKFETAKEKDAFIRGMEASSGWLDYFIFEEDS